MKTIFKTFLVTLLFPAVSFSQFAYGPEFVSGNMKYLELTNPANYTIIGTGPTQMGAADFSADGLLYGISASNNGLYRIDTSNATGTLIGTVAPPVGEFWTGMALDPTDGTLYVASTDGVNSSFFTLDPSNAAITPIGTNSAESGVVGIAFDDAGQMYAIYLVRKFFKINKTNAVPTLVGNLNTACTAGQWHGLDFCQQNQTMYMTSYNAFTFDSQVWTINLLTGANTLVGSVGVWTASLATRPPLPAIPLTANFTSDTTNICLGQNISFTDLSTGSPDSWSWTFEGGTPAVSTEQNPTVTYNAPGVFDVTLEVYNGTNTSTLYEQDYLTVVVCTGNDNRQSRETFSLYPNPAGDNLYVFLPVGIAGNCSFTIYTPPGIQVAGGYFPWQGISAPYLVDISSLARGIYILQIVNNDGTICSRKFVKK